MLRSLFVLTFCALSGTFVDCHAADTLVITEAVYGDLPDGPKSDVREKVRMFAKDGVLRLEAGNDLFGDPAEQVGKKLLVKYQLNGKAMEVTVKEGETLLIPQPVLKGELKLLAARYGDLPDGSSDNVLDTVRIYLKNNKLEIDVNNDVLGDPASGVFKRLRVEYQIGDVKLAKSVYEGGTMVIEVPGEPETKNEKSSSTPAPAK